MSERKGYTYDKKLRRFRGPDGRFVSGNTIRALSNRIVRDNIANTSRLVDLYFKGSISPASFVREMRVLIKNATVMEYALGRGGINALTGHDYSRIGGLLKNQYGYLNQLAAGMVDGSVSEEMARYRASLYMDTTRAAHERGKAEAWDINLPEYPALHPNCACSWSITQKGNRIEAYWRTMGLRTCDACNERAAQYSPFIKEL